MLFFLMNGQLSEDWHIYESTSDTFEMVDIDDVKSIVSPDVEQGAMSRLVKTCTGC